MSFLRAELPWSIRQTDAVSEVDVYKKYWIIAEGSKTEKWYFTELAEHCRELKISPNVKVEFLDRDPKYETSSAPGFLIDKSVKLKNYLKETREFEEGDQILVVFDLDVFKTKTEVLERLLSDAQTAGILLGLTNPAFEIFLLLHRENAVRIYIHPKSEELLENRKERGRRFSDRYFSYCFGINSKKNENEIRQLVMSLSIAIAEERQLNQNISSAVNCISCLTSTVGYELEKIMDTPIQTKSLIYGEK